MPGKDQSWDESWRKKGNRGIVLTDVPRSQLDLPLHSAALAPRLFSPLIVGNLLLAGDNTKNAKVQEYTKTRFPPITQQYFRRVNVYKYFVAVPHSRPSVGKRYYLK